MLLVAACLFSRVEARLFRTYLWLILYAVRTQPLMKINWCWKDVIYISDGKVQSSRFHGLHILAADRPPLQTVPLCLRSLLAKGEHHGDSLQPPSGLHLRPDATVGAFLLTTRLTNLGIHLEFCFCTIELLRQNGEGQLEDTISIEAPWNSKPFLDVASDSSFQFFHC